MKVKVDLVQGLSGNSPGSDIGIDDVDVSFLQTTYSFLNVLPDTSFDTLDGVATAANTTTGVRASMEADWPAPLSMADFQNPQLLMQWVSDSASKQLDKVRVDAPDYIATIDFGNQGPTAQEFVENWTEADLLALSPQINGASGGGGNSGGGGGGNSGNTGGSETPSAGADTLTGTEGKDTIKGLGGNDTISGLGGKDKLNGNGGSDSIDGGAGKDNLKGAGGKDTLEGGAGNDILSGGNGSDSLDGGAGKDRINGDKGDDTIQGGDGNDVIRGGAGNDEIVDGKGNDKMRGDGGADVFKFIEGVAGTGGTDRILRYQIDSDRIEGMSPGNPAIVSGTLTGLALRDAFEAQGVDITFGSKSVTLNTPDGTLVVRFQGGAENEAAFWDTVTWDFG